MKRKINGIPQKLRNERKGKEMKDNEMKKRTRKEKTKNSTMQTKKLYPLAAQNPVFF